MKKFRSFRNKKKHDVNNFSLFENVLLKVFPSFSHLEYINLNGVLAHYLICKYKLDK